MKARSNSEKKDRMTNRFCNGFTLLEMLIVLVLGASVTALVLPRFSKLLDVIELKSDVRTLASMLRFARGQAVAGYRETSVILDLRNRTYRTSELHNNSSPFPGLKSFSSDLDITLLTADSELINEDIGAIRFFADGSSTGGRITLATAGRIYFVDVNWLTGSLVIHDEKIL